MHTNKSNIAKGIGIAMADKGDSSQVYDGVRACLGHGLDQCSPVQEVGLEVVLCWYA